MKINLEKLSLEIAEVSREAGEFIQSQINQFSNDDVQEKSLGQLVSFVDIETEKIIVNHLKRLLPEAAFITEEDTEEKNDDADYHWVIDPLDGTTNFIHQIPAYSVSIALLHHKNPVIGVVYEINKQECFHTFKGGKSFLNEKEINVKKSTELHETLIATGIPYYDFNLMEKYTLALQQFAKSTRGIRRLGSAAVDLAYVACGRFDVFFEHGLHVWDVAAGVLLVENAGGKVTNFNGSDVDIFGVEMLAASNAIFPKAVKITKESFQ